MGAALATVMALYGYCFIQDFELVPIFYDMKFVAGYDRNL
jgi:hypothetical protein